MVRLRAGLFGAAMLLLIGAAVPPVREMVLAARPGSEFAMFSMLNGQPIRWIQLDGGAAGLFGTSPQCLPLSNSGGATNVVAPVLKLTPNVPINLCTRPAPGGDLGDPYSGWDGGCNAIPGDPNFGDPLQPWQPHYVMPASNAAWLCAVSDAGTITTPVFRMN